MAQTETERKKANREKMRRYRERKAAEAAKSTPVTRNGSNGNDVTPAPTIQRDAVTSALAAMKWLEVSDDAAVAQAKSLAKLVDELEHVGETTKALSAHRALQTVLNNLGGTPAVRMQHELRALRAKSAPEDPDDTTGDQAAKPSGVVTKFERPPKRGGRTG